MILPAVPDPPSLHTPAVSCRRLSSGDSACMAQASCFTGSSGVAEFHLIVEPKVYGSFETQLHHLLQVYRHSLAELGLPAESCVFRRFFFSDLANQGAAFRGLFAPASDLSPFGALSCVGQAPAGHAKIALWAMHRHDPCPQESGSGNHTAWSLKRGPLTHLWTTGLAAPAPRDSGAQTRTILAQYEDLLAMNGMNLADHVVRTWLFVRDIDVNYRGMVEARRELFERRGLRADTHYLASSGIEAASETPATKLSLDAYAIGGLRPEQVSYLYARSHLSPTHLYGVTFERGVALAYRDRKQLLLSGTASIDRHGRILHEHDVVKQLDRIFENMDALLQEGGARLRDMGIFLVYLRDTSDAGVIRERLRHRIGAAPMLLVRAPVCRTGWLAEIEGQASVPLVAEGLPEF